MEVRLVNFLYVVSSNINYFEKTFPIFIEGVPKNKREKFVFVVNGSEKEFVEEKEGVKIKYVTDNSFEYSPLIDLVKHPNYYNCDFIFLLHDTCTLGRNFFKKVEKFNPSFDTIAVSSLETSFGWLKKSFILSKSKFILSMKNCSKEKQVENRGKLFRIAQTKTTFQTNYRVLSKKKIYGGKVGRVVEYYDGVDLYKNRANVKENDEILEP